MVMRFPVLIFCIAVHLVLLGCGALRPPQPYETVRPQTPPVRHLTSFSESLRCMDELFVAYGIGERGIGTVYVTSEGVLDKTGKGLGGDNRDVLISTLSKMSATSGAFKFIDYDARDLEGMLRHVDTFAGSVDKFTWPSYKIKGAITQLDENVDARSVGLSFALSAVEGGWSKDWQATVVSVDFNIGEMVSQQMLNGLTANNTMAIIRRGVAVDGGGHFQKAGLFFNVSLDKNEGIYAALRALIELSTIEVLGKLAKVPYFKCLQIEHTNPEILALTADWFATMPEPERVSFVQRLLARRGYYSGAVTGTRDPATRDAIARYQAATDLIPSGRIDLALYRQLIGQDLHERVVQAPEGAPVATLEAAKPFLTLTTPRGATPTYRVNERLALWVQASQDAYLSCYYRDGRQRISRVYPNRFQPGGLIQANQRVTIPATPHFSLQLDTPNSTEAVLCVAAPEDLGARMPDHLRPDLEALPVESLEAVVEALRRLAPHTLAQARVLVQVQP